MSENAIEIPFFSMIEEDIVKLYKDEKDRQRARDLFAQASEETSRMDVDWDAKPNELKRFLAKWHIRFHYGIHWRKPLYPLRLIRNYSLAFLYKRLGINKHVFRGIEFDLTFRCNFKCHHCLCNHIDETETREELRPDEYEMIVNDAMKLGATTFGMEGGEPFVNKEWEDIVARWKPKYNHIVVSTNGYMLTEELVKKCRDIGIDTMNVSLDSGIPELHDVFRRKSDSFERAIKGIERCRKHGIKVIINTVVHKANLYTEGLRKLFEYAEENKLMINVLFGKAVGDFAEKGCMLEKEDFKAFEKIVAPFNYWSIHHSGEVKSSCGGEGCPGTTEFVNITPYGDIINCANSHVYFGNVREEPFEQIRNRALYESDFGKYNSCFLTQDEDFMNVYYPALAEKEKGKAHISLVEFNTRMDAYKKEKAEKKETEAA